jgi:hypothetical protein
VSREAYPQITFISLWITQEQAHQPIDAKEF